MGSAGWASLNRIINQKPIIEAAASRSFLAIWRDNSLHQLNNSRHFVCENPKGSDLYAPPVWQEVARYPNVVQVLCDMCAAGLKCRATGLLVKKPTEVWASDSMIVKEILPRQCNQRHKHATLSGTHHGEARTHLSRTLT